MIEDVEVIIPTLFKPVTLEPLLEALEAQGVRKATVLENMPVNDAWRKGIAEATRRYLFILNDDIEISPRFVNETLYAHGLGYTYVYGRWVDRFTGITQHIEEHLARGCHLGGAFSLDMECRVPPIPDGFKIYHGDDWLFWQHAKHGRCGESSGAEYKTEGAHSCKHPQMNDISRRWFGMTLDAVARREHILSRQFFIIPNGVRWVMDEAGVDYTVTPMDTNRAFMGSAAGLLE